MKFEFGIKYVKEMTEMVQSFHNIWENNCVCTGSIYSHGVGKRICVEKGFQLSKKLCLLLSLFTLLLFLLFLANEIRISDRCQLKKQSQIKRERKSLTFSGIPRRLRQF